MIGQYLQELGDVTDHGSEHELVLVTVKPSQLGDPGEQVDQPLHNLQCDWSIQQCNAGF